MAINGLTPSSFSSLARNETNILSPKFQETFLTNWRYPAFPGERHADPHCNFSLISKVFRSLKWANWVLKRCWMFWNKCKNNFTIIKLLRLTKFSFSVSRTWEIFWRSFDEIFFSLQIRINSDLHTLQKIPRKQNKIFQKNEFPQKKKCLHLSTISFFRGIHFFSEWAETYEIYFW